MIIGSGPGGYVAAVRAGQLGSKSRDHRKRKGRPARRHVRTARLHSDKGVAERRTSLSKSRRIRAFWPEGRRPQLRLARRSEIQIRRRREKLRRRDLPDEKEQGHGLQRLWQDRRAKARSRSHLADGKKETIETKNIIIATGSVVRPIPGFETDGKQVVNSDHILELNDVPKSMVVMGSGAVGVEFASVYARFGCDTTVVELLDRIVPIEDADVSKELARSFKKQGIKIETGIKLDKLEKTKKAVKVSGKNAKGEDVSLRSRNAARRRRPHALSRRSRARKHKGQVVNPRGTIKVNEYCETDEPNVFAIGDVIDTAWLAHLASKEGILVVEKIAGKKVEPIKHNLVPNCTYCDPEVASVGLTEAKAKEAGYDVKVGKFPFSASGKARILGETDGFVKIVAEKKYDEVLGVHIIGPHATELLAEACVGMALETTADELGRIMHAHPTVQRVVMEAAEGVHDLTIHM